jgi:hypothetical protein
VTISSTAGGTGTVTSVGSGTGLTGGPITTTGTLSIANTGVSASTYGDSTHVPQIAVNAQGQITSASSTAISFPTAPVTSVSGSGSGISVSPTTGSVVVSNTGVTSIIAGSNITISPSGGTGAVTINSTAGGTGTVTSVSTGTGLSGGPITTSGTISLASAYAGNGIGTVNGIAKGNGSGTITAATAGTDYVIPSGSITGTSGNVTGTVAIGNGGTGANTASGARTNLGLGTVATQTAPSGTSSQLLSNNGTGGFNNVTVGSGLTYSGGTLSSSAGGGTVTSVGTSGSVNGITLTGGPITTSGTITLGGTLGSIANSQLSNSSITVTAGTGLSGGGSVSLGGSTTLTNAGVTSLTAGTGISLSGSTGGVTITNTVSALPSGATQGQVLLEGASSAGWYNTSINVTAYSSLSAAQTAAGTNGTLYFPRAYTIPSSVSTITQNVIVEGLLTLSAACLFSGTIKAPIMQIFSGGTVTIGQATPEIYPEWFGTPKNGTSDDSAGITAALNAVTLTTVGAVSTFANQFVVLTGNYTLNSTITITGGRMFKVIGGAQFTAGTATNGIVYSGNGSNVQGDIPAMNGFSGTALYLAGTNVMNFRMFGCYNCGVGLKLGAVSNRDSLDNKVHIMFLENTTIGVYIYTDNSTEPSPPYPIVAMQGNEIYCNFYTLDSQPSSTAYAAYWANADLTNCNGNTLEFRAIEFNGKSNVNGFYNASTTSGTSGVGQFVEGWNIKCDDWFGGINSSNASSAMFAYGYFQSCTMQFSMQGSLNSLPWSVFQIKGDGNRVVFTNGGGNYNINSGGQPVSRFTCPTSPNSRSSFNTGGTSFPPFNNRLTCQYNLASGSSIAPGDTLTLYAYSPITDGYTQASGVIGASNNFSAVSFTQFGLILESAVDNNTVNANEIILTFRNVSTNTLSSGNFNFILTVGL